MVSERRKHSDKPVASICQGEDAELVEDISSVRDRGEQPVDVAFVDTLWEESNRFEKRSGVKTKGLE